MSKAGPARDIHDRLIGLAMRLLGSDVKLPEPFPVAQQLSELGLTSLKMVNLMLAIEEEFDLSLPAADITPETFQSIDTVAALLQRLGP